MRKRTSLIILLVVLNSTQMGVFNTSSYFQFKEGFGSTMKKISTRLILNLLFFIASYFQ